MLIPSLTMAISAPAASLSRRVNANSQQEVQRKYFTAKLIKKGEC